jgi:hypothetical protein
MSKNKVENQNQPELAKKLEFADRCQESYSNSIP